MMGARFGLKSLVFGSDTAKMGFDVFNNINNALEGLKSTGEGALKVNGLSTAEDLGLVGGHSKNRTQVGETYGRLMNDLRLIRINDNDFKSSMGRLEIESLNSDIDFSELSVKWKRKYGSSLVDIPDVGRDKRMYELTADDVGFTVIVEVRPRVETEDRLNITYSEFGPICIDESTKKSLLNSIKSGIVRFPIKVLEHGCDIILLDSDCNGCYANNLNSPDLIRDLLVVTTEDVKVLRNGVSSSVGLNAEKRTEWSAKFFGGNIRVVLDANNNCEFVLVSGDDTHRQSIRIKATSKNSRDILTLTIRCLNAKHLLSLEAILSCSLWKRTSAYQGMDGYDKCQDGDNGECTKMDILCYIAKMQEETIELLHREKRSREEKSRINNEKALLENELNETISAYQAIISQMSVQSNAEAPAQDSEKHSNIAFASNENRGLLYGYNGGMYVSSYNKERVSYGKDASVGVCSGKNAQSRDSKSCSPVRDGSCAHQTKIREIESELTELRGQLDKVSLEKKELADDVEKYKIEIKNKDRQLQTFDKYDIDRYKGEIEKIHEYKDRILELESQNSEKQEAIQNIVAEKSKLSRDLSNLRSDYNKLKDQHNQLNKKYISLTIASCENKSEDSREIRVNSEIEDLKQKVLDLESLNSELNATVSNLKHRVRKLAMIKY